MAAMDRDHDEAGDIRLAKVMVAAADVSQDEAVPLEGRKDLSAGRAGQARQPTATWSSTSSVELESGMPSFLAASR